MVVGLAVVEEAADALLAEQLLDTAVGADIPTSAICPHLGGRPVVIRSVLRRSLPNGPK